MINKDSSFLLNLKKSQFVNVDSVIKIPDEEIIYIGKTKLYIVKYAFNKKNNMALIRFTSKDSKFKTVFSVDYFDMSVKNYIGAELKDNGERLDIRAINDLVDKYFEKNIGYVKRESYSLYRRAIFLNEFIEIIAFGFIFATIANVIIRRIVNWAKEKYATGSAENNLNDSLFKGTVKDDPAFANFKLLEAALKNVIQSKTPALILCGPPGMSKTFNVRRTFYFMGKQAGEDYVILKGASLSLSSTYDMLYKYRKKIIIFDDFDTPLRDPEIINLLKSITDTYDVRYVSLPREKQITGGLDQTVSNAPDKFEFEGKIIIITNLSLNEIDSALKSRAPIFEIKYNSKEVLASLKLLIHSTHRNVPIETKEEVLEYLAKQYYSDRTVKIDYRIFKNALDIRCGNEDMWKEIIKTMVSNNK